MKKKIEEIKKILGSQILYVRMPESERHLHKNVSNYQTLAEALAVARKGCIVKVFGGIYREELQVTKEVTLERARPEDEVIIFNNKGPVILVNMLEPTDKLSLVKIKVASPIISSETYTRNPDFEATTGNDATNKFVVDENIESLITVMRGSLFCEEVLLSIAGALGGKVDAASIVALNNGCYGSFNKSHFRGSEGVNRRRSIGLLSKQSNLVVRDCKITNCSLAGMYFSGGTKNQVKVLNNKITGCGYGIVALGCFSPLVTKNMISGCQLSGVKVGICSKGVISYNDITKSGTGVELVSCNALVLSNRVTSCKRDGVLSRTREQQRCEARIKSNELIAENQGSGVRIRGINNHTKVQSNAFIGHNMGAGVLVEMEAEPHIFKNVISKNMGQGVLVVENSSAFVEKNSILDNVKAGVALGGGLSARSCVVNNTIQGGRSEGVFLLEAEEAWLVRNEISQNYDGIICCTSVPFILDNLLRKNKNNGIFCLKNSGPIIEDNRFEKNQAAGVFVADRFTGQIRHNSFQNEVDIVIEKAHPEEERILTDNQFKGDCRVPSNYSCCIF